MSGTGGTALVQARLSSKRLPGKVLADLCGEPMILRQLRRVAAAELVDRVVVVTSTDPSDDTLVDVLAAHGVETFRGPLDDVLARYIAAAESVGADRVIRVTADCPLIDPDVIDAVIHAHESSGSDYASNVLDRTYPRGLDVESVAVSALRRIAGSADAFEREHVTAGIYRRPAEFSLTSVTQPVDRSHLRWTVDTPADLAFVRSVYGELLPAGDVFPADAVYALLERRPDLVHLDTGSLTP